jgi:hypothetical protein
VPCPPSVPAFPQPLLLPDILFPCFLTLLQQAIAAVLGMSNSAPELIQLDLRENSFTEQGLTILVSRSGQKHSPTSA